MKRLFISFTMFFFRKDDESEFQYSVLRFLTYSCSFLLVPNFKYYAHTYTFNNSYQCDNYISLNISLGLQTMQHMYPFLLTFLIFSAVGFLFHISALISFVLFFALTLQTLQGCYANHAYYPMGLVLLVWVFNTQVSRYSVDHVLFKYLKIRQKPTLAPFKSSVFSYLKVHFGLVFFFAVTTKLKYSGLDWILSDNLSNRIAMQNFFQNQPTKLFPVLKNINMFFSESILLSQVAGFLVVLIESSMIFLIFIKNRKIQLVLVSLMALLQVGFYMIMYVNFYPWMILYFSWIVSLLAQPIDKIENWISIHRRH